MPVTKYMSIPNVTKETGFFF